MKMIRRLCWLVAVTLTVTRLVLVVLALNVKLLDCLS